MVRASPIASYLANYSDVDMEKVGERVVTGDKQIANLFYVSQESERETYGSNST
jgi:hypothetical protein